MLRGDRILDLLIKIKCRVYGFCGVYLLNWGVPILKYLPYWNPVLVQAPFDPINPPPSWLVDLRTVFLICPYMRAWL